MAGAPVGSASPRRLALVLANGAYTQRPPLSKTVATAVELRRKLEAMGFEVVGADDQDLAGMQTATFRWLCLVEAAAESAEDGDEATERTGAAAPPGLLLLFVFCGHGRAGQFLPVDCPRGAPGDSFYCFFEDFLFRLYGLCSEEGRRHWKSPVRTGRSAADCWLPAGCFWRLPVRVVAIIESCRRLAPEEKQAFEEQRSRIANGRRHLLPSLAAMRPDLAQMGGAEWDAARLSFLSRLGPGSPELLMALSSESTTPSYDVVFLRSITEAIDRPVRLGGILERASQDTLRRTGHKQKPVLLLFVHDNGALLPSPSAPSKPSLQDIILANVEPSMSSQKRRSSSLQGLRRNSRGQDAMALRRGVLSDGPPSDDSGYSIVDGTAASSSGLGRGSDVPRARALRRSDSLPPAMPPTGLTRWDMQSRAKLLLELGLALWSARYGPAISAIV